MNQDSKRKDDIAKQTILLGNEQAPPGNVQGPDLNKVGDVESQINKGEVDLDTLDEPIMETLKRDLVKIWNKILFVLVPKSSPESQNKLKNWDFWGPLLLCLLLSITLSFGRNDEHTGLVFILVFVIVWFGGLVVALNCRFLGANLSVFQSICILGYCIFPIDIAAILIQLFYFLPMFVKILLALGGCGWSSFSSVGFVNQLIEPKKKILAAYPIFLFYLFLSWFILAK